MKICWSTLEDIYLTKSGNFKKGTKTYIYVEACSCCGYPYLTRKDRPGKFCSNSCSKFGDNNIMKNPNISRKNRTNSKGNVRDRGLALYETYVKQLSYAEETRAVYTRDDIKIVEVKCSKCKNWFRPTDRQIWNRIACLDGKKLGESRFYCSSECKADCDVYWKSTRTNHLKDNFYDLRIWRKEILMRADYMCEYCGKKATDAHHIRPIKLEPFFILDPDNGISCCEKCHYTYGHRGECSTSSLASVIC
jgi:hypothetical protein